MCSYNIRSYQPTFWRGGGETLAVWWIDGLDDGVVVVVVAVE